MKLGNQPCAPKWEQEERKNIPEVEFLKVNAILGILPINFILETTNRI
jgi:hypothetical protein